MNINIINKCNNNCYFCFQDHNKNTELMGIEHVEELLNWYGHYTNSIGVLGGEPTLHPQFIDICNLIINYGYTLSVFSNLLCSENIVYDMLNLYNSNFLFNICHDRKFDEQFNNNYKIILNRNFEDAWHRYSAIFLGITLTGKSDYDDYNINYLYQLLEEDTRHVIKGVRISHAVPFNNIYQLNTHFGNDCVKLITKCKQINPLLHFNFDCAVNLCIFGEDNFNRLKNISNVYNLKLECTDPVLDIGISNQVSWCAADTKNIYNIADFKSPYELISAMKMDRYINQKSMIHHCDYKNCNCLECQGLCYGINSHL